LDYWVLDGLSFEERLEELDKVRIKKSLPPCELED